MTKGQRAISSLLAVVAVLLGLNLLRGTPEAEAQVETGITGACCLPQGGACAQQTAAMCAALGGVYSGDGSSCNDLDVFCPKVVAIDTAQIIGSEGTASWRVFRLWSDGHVDTTLVPFAGPGVAECDIGPAGTCTREVPITPTCPEDINEDLSVNVLDLIDLLLAFGTTCPAAG